MINSGNRVGKKRQKTRSQRGARSQKGLTGVVASRTNRDSRVKSDDKCEERIKGEGGCLCPENGNRLHKFTIEKLLGLGYISFAVSFR